MQSPSCLWSKDFVLVTLLNLMSFFGFQLLVPVLSLYMVSVGGGDSDIGLIFGLYSASALASRMMAGWAADRWGRKWLLVAGTLIAFLSMPLYAVATTVVSLSALRLFHGLATGILGTVCGVLVADLAPARRRGEALGYYSLGMILPMAIGPGLAVWLMAAPGLPLSGFDLVFATGGLAALGSVILSVCVAETGRCAPAPAAATGARGLGNVFVREALPYTLVMTCAAFGTGAIYSFLPVYLSLGHGASIGAYFLVNAIALTISRPLIGLVSDRIDRHKLVVPLILIGALGISSLALSTAVPIVVLAAILWGVGFGALNPTLTALVVDLVSPERRGAAVATLMAAIDIGVSLGSIAFAWVAQAAGYAAVFPAAGVMCLIGIAYFVGFRRGWIRWP